MTTQTATLLIGAMIQLTGWLMLVAETASQTRLSRQWRAGQGPAIETTWDHIDSIGPTIDALNGRPLRLWVGVGLVFAGLTTATINSLVAL